MANASRSRKNKSAKRDIYCGNNNNSSKLTTHDIGTRASCFRKGVGVGLYVLPVDREYLERYDPIDARKFYCGEQNTLPVGYDLYGNNFICFSKGVGLGRKLKADRSR